MATSHLFLRYLFFYFHLPSLNHWTTAYYYLYCNHHRCRRVNHLTGKTSRDVSFFFTPTITKRYAEERLVFLKYVITLKFFQWNTYRGYTECPIVMLFMWTRVVSLISARKQRTLIIPTLHHNIKREDDEGRFCFFFLRPLVTEWDDVKINNVNTTSHGFSVVLWYNITPG